ncbi:STAS domain-containing protein [Pseudomonas fulva]|nr:STAS domain-containing protein [Pseudomonas fulva]MBF8779251.1 STAS domain-containing protein [Pseudomonas fulva]
MAVEADFSLDEKRLTIKIRGRFDFGKHQDFRNAYEHLPARAESVVVDLGAATYLDSSALGMLLLLRDHQGEQDAGRIQVINTSSDVYQILAISNFTQLFEISQRPDVCR